MKNLLNISGFITINIKDSDGNIVKTQYSRNIVLNSGIKILQAALVGDTTIPLQYPPDVDKKLYNLNISLPNTIKYFQLGANVTVPTSGDAPIAGDGTLGPTNTSAVYPVYFSYLNTNTLRLVCVIPPSKSNNMTFSEAVLLAPKNLNPVIYSWFARTTFQPVTKPENQTLEILWDLVLANG